MLARAVAADDREIEASLLLSSAIERVEHFQAQDEAAARLAPLLDIENEGFLLRARYCLLALNARSPAAIAALIGIYRNRRAPVQIRIQIAGELMVLAPHEAEDCGAAAVRRRLLARHPEGTCSNDDADLLSDELGMESNKMSKIPSDEEFARAGREMSESFRNLDNVCKSIKRRFKGLCPLDDVYILPLTERFKATVFFKETKDIEACKANGIVQELIDFTYAELERVGRGKRTDITVEFEFDSDENVTKEWGGDYFLRMR